MSLFECKMCGGALEFTEGAAVAKCKYCGTAQTLPKTVDEIMQNLFVRANALRLKNEFDKAEKIYERIIQNDPTQSEAYWGLILCKYGIEYVDDPETKQKIPTCHRASYDSIIADDDFRLALEYADEDQRAVLDEQAREIDRIQKEILALAQKEETYDVFICYKETDENGKRTRDSVIANDIYYQLKQEGFKVFYAAITLENKLGSAYEPIIFAALHSAKVMLAIGTKPEYFNAVWVKNEWSRYLKVIQKDRSKLLIPCYRDMDAYELPDEFAHLQAQDMAKIGFINDLVRGIRKVVKKDAPKAAAAVPVSSSPNTSALLKRAFIFLEDGDWSQADDFCEKVLNQDPENAQAYLGKLMAELHVSKQTMLEHCETPFDTNHNYMKAVRFADDALKTTLEGYAEAVRNRNQKMVAKKSKRKKKVALVIIPLVSLLVAAALVLNAFVVPRNEQPNNEPIPPSVTDSQALDATTQATETTAETPETTTKASEATTKITFGNNDEISSIKLTQNDISAGNLQLISPEHAYVFPSHTSNLVNVFDNRPYITLENGTKTRLYKVRNSDLMLDKIALQALNSMIEAFYEQYKVADILITWGHRTMQDQQDLYNRYVADYPGYTDAQIKELLKSQVDVAGYSEHHLGTAVDLKLYSDAGVSYTLDDEPDYFAWLKQNCWKYGYILRYPAEKAEVTGISYEPYHFRYVGIPHAYYIMNNGLCLEEYLDQLRKTTSLDGKHLTISVDGGATYEIYYVAMKNNSIDVPIPNKYPYTISGDNLNGFIVTVAID